MTSEAVVRVAREIDAYVGAAWDATRVGVIAVPLRLLVALREALKEAK